MPRRNLLLPLLLVAMVVVFLGLLVRLLLLRYERGDVYPEYSTLRSDPLGTRAFYEALEGTGRYRVLRGFASVHRELEQKPDALLYLGLSTAQIMEFSGGEIAALDAYVRNGGRVIITLQPEEASGTDEPEVKSGKPAKEEASPENGPTQQEKYEREKFDRTRGDSNPFEVNSAKEKADKKKAEEEYQPSLAATWGFGWARHGAKADTAAPDHIQPDGRPSPDVFAWCAIYGGAEANVPWKSALFFTRIERPWDRIYMARGKPVIMRRHLGKGDILLATDSYFVSNEALRDDRRPRLLNFFAGWPGTLLFDEAHLGTEQQEGIMALAERFRLEGFIYGLCLVAALVLWRNSVPLVPPRAEEGLALGGAVSGKDSRSGLINLLRRNIPARELLPLCFAEWKRAVLPGRTAMKPRLPEMDAALSAPDALKPDNLVATYHDLRHINAPGKFKGTHATKS